jgi:phospholipase C
MVVISPWSKGGFVNSQVFDHTSLIRFIEARYAGNDPALIESNITPWRRAVAGDLTSAFNFATPNAARVPLPATSGYVPPDALRHPDYVPVPPANQALPAQEPGVRPARALPYELHAHGAVDAAAGAFRIAFANSGAATAVFQVRSGNAADLPRGYTVEPDKALADAWTAADGLYDLSVYGPNGFLRAFKGGLPAAGRANLDVAAHYDERDGGLSLHIVNLSATVAVVSVLDKYTGEVVEERLAPRESVTQYCRLERQFGWYDLVVTVAQDPGFVYRLAGHVESGADSATDPAIGGLLPIG